MSSKGGVVNIEEFSDKNFALEREKVNSLKVDNEIGRNLGLDGFMEYIYSNATDDTEYVRQYYLQLLSASMLILL